jgi:hypothetical protein
MVKYAIDDVKGKLIASQDFSVFDDAYDWAKALSNSMQITICLREYDSKEYLIKFWPPQQLVYVYAVKQSPKT